MASSTSTTESVQIRFSTLDRLYLWGCAVAMLVVLTIMVREEFGANPPPHVLPVCVLIELPFIWLVIKAYKFEVRADSEEIFHRESVTRRISLDSVEQIRVAFEDTCLPDLGLSVQRTKIEIFGDEKRIMVSWRSKKMAPLLEFLEQRFPQKIEWVDSLPDT